MKFLRLAIVVLFGFNVAVFAQRTLSDADIEAAIKAGNNRKVDQLISDCIATAGFGESFAAGMAGGIRSNGAFDITVSANAGRIAFLAADAKRLYKPYTPADVSDSLRTPGIFVFADPQKPTATGNSVSVSAPIERIVLKSKARPDVVVQPDIFETEPVEWANLLGGKVDGNRGLGRFSFASVRELPPGDFDVVVITPTGERRCKVGTKDRAKLLSGF